MSQEIDLLTEIRDLLQVMAEPALAQRDAKLRSSLRAVVGSGAKKAKAAQLMDGSRTRSQVAKESGMDDGNLSRLVKALSDAKLITDQKNPKILVKVPYSFFSEDGSNE
ncbi:MAG: hypothetical protein IPL75_03185 [Acidobacteria bacterium]|nr:hypothetical protein [Acidobacteriota bacterium]